MIIIIIIIVIIIIIKRRKVTPKWVEANGHIERIMPTFKQVQRWLELRGRTFDKRFKQQSEVIETHRINVREKP